MMRKILSHTVRFYQIAISPWLGNCCRFYPSCSEYTKESIEKHGAAKGVLKGFLRILRCNPFFKGGVDVVK